MSGGVCGMTPAEQDKIDRFMAWFLMRRSIEILVDQTRSEWVDGRTEYDLPGAAGFFRRRRTVADDAVGLRPRLAMRRFPA